MLQRLRLWVKREPVLAISAACAVLSMALTPPSAAYLGYNRHPGFDPAVRTDGGGGGVSGLRGL